MGVKVGSRESQRDCSHEGVALRSFGILARQGVRADKLTSVEEQMMIGGLRAMVKGLVADYNRAAGAAVLYFCEYVSVWALFAQRGKNQCDTCVATGYSNVGDLAALVDRLQNEEVLA